MNLCSYNHKGKISFGVAQGTLISDLGSNTAGWESIKDALGATSKHIDEQIKHAATIAAEDVTFLPVVPDATHVIGIGINTKSHFDEARHLLKLDQYPTKPWLFVRPVTSLVGHLGDLEVPPTSDLLDYEAEIGLVIGQRCRNVSVEDAWSVVAGLTCFNDGSVRDYQIHTPQLTAGKIFPRTGAVGPWVTLKDAIPPLGDLQLELILNGQSMQQMRIDDLIFGFDQIVSYVSQVVELQPGDIILTGSAAGIGALRDPQVWLKPGDRVEVVLPGIGTLTNGVVKAA